LRRTQLKDELADKGGHFFDRADDYRRAVDQRLFQLGEERYRILVDTLIQLRHPQLTKTPDETRLSNALTAALPPVAAEMIDTIAEAMSRLEEDRSQLKSYELAHAAIGKFERTYRRYAGARVRTFAREVRAARTKFEEASAEVNIAAAQLASALDESTAAETANITAKREAEAADAAYKGILQHPDGLKAADLATKRHLADEAEERLTASEKRSATAAADLKTESERQQTAGADLDRATETLAVNRHKALDLARSVGMVAQFEHAKSYSVWPNELVRDGQTSLQSERGNLLTAIRGRRSSIDAVVELLRDVDNKISAMASAERDENVARGLLDEARKTLAAAENALTDEIDALGAAWRRHLGGCGHLMAIATEDVVDALVEWAHSLEGENPAAHELIAKCRHAYKRLTEALAELKHQEAAVGAELESVTKQIADLQTGSFERPPIPHTRKADRDSRPGQALWQAVDFLSEADDGVRAGLEAALEASGLLDAWILPDGRMFIGETEHDVSLVSRPLVTGRTLADWLVHCGDPSVQDAVETFLCAVSCTDTDDGAEMWVSPAGHFRLGALSGTWEKSRATYIGHSARERARLKRIQELEAIAAGLGEQLAGLETAITSNAATTEAIEQVERTCPPDTNLRKSHDSVRSATNDLHRATENVRTRANDTAVARQALSACRKSAEQAALDTDLPCDKRALEHARNTCDTLSDAHLVVVEHCSNSIRAAQSLQDTNERVETARSRHHASAEDVKAAAISATSARAVYDALKESVGASSEQWERRLIGAQKRLDDAKADVESTDDRRLSAVAIHTQAVGAHETATRALATRVEERQRAASNLQTLAATGLMAAGAPNVPFPDIGRTWTVDETRGLAADLNQALSDIRDNEWDGLQSKIYSEFVDLQNALAQLGYVPYSNNVDGFGLVVTIAVQNKTGLSPAEVLAQIDTEITQRRTLLTESETKILEDHLQSEMSVQIRNLIQDAEQYVERVNAEIEKRPTSTGTYFRLRWIPLTEAQGAPADLEDARKRLLKTNADLWTENDRQAIGAMLQRRIEEERLKAEESGGSSLREQLSAALDYRQWHRFVVERNAMGKWISISQPASGGERALGLTIPMFAAVASFYGDEHSTRPRLVLLDEAFAGIDDGVRAHCMGLIHEFDLDFVITSEREWACYKTLPGVAICQIQRHDKFDAIHVSRWRWDGKTRSKMEEPARLMLNRSA
ncbi:TIGR02680 family protein, partial [Bradyrhizobium sp. UFLA05-109]